MFLRALSGICIIEKEHLDKKSSDNKRNMRWEKNLLIATQTDTIL